MYNLFFKFQLSLKKRAMNNCASVATSGGAQKSNFINVNYYCNCLDAYLCNRYCII